MTPEGFVDHRRGARRGAGTGRTRGEVSVVAWRGSLGGLPTAREEPPVLGSPLALARTVFVEASRAVSARRGTQARRAGGSSESRSAAPPPHHQGHQP